MINFLKLIPLAYAVSVNPLLNGLTIAHNLEPITTIKQIIENKVCEISQIKLSPRSSFDNSISDNLTMICPQNQLTKTNTFLNLEFKNEKLENINLIIPLNETSLNRLI